jgi:hypothetical protein
MNQDFFEAILNEQNIHNVQPELFNTKECQTYHTSFDISQLPDPTTENFGKLIQLLPKFSLYHYRPNLNSKQNKRKILDSLFHAYGAVNHILDEHKFSDCPQSLRETMFGSLSNDLSRYLDHLLIIRENDHKKYDPTGMERNGECYRYRVNAIAMELVARILISSGYSPKANKSFEAKSSLSPIVGNSIKSYMNSIEDKFNTGEIAKQKEALTGFFMVDAYSDEFLNGFKYTTTKHCPRLFHICQNIRKDLKHEIFSAMGYAFDYDVQSAAPSFLYQAAIAVKPELEATLVTIRDYILNTKTIRTRIANDYNMDYATVKKMINARFAGANMTVNKEHSLFNMVHCNRELMERLKEDEFFIKLKVELKIMWDAISKSQKYGIFFKKDERLKSKDKWKFYFSMESDFINFVRSHLEIKDYKTFLEHDGFRTDMPIDIKDLEDAYYQYSGIMLKILPNLKNPCTHQEFVSRMNSLVSSKANMVDFNGIISLTQKVSNVSQAQSVLKNELRKEANDNINDFLGSFINHILDGKFSGVSSEDIIKELTSKSSSSTKKRIRNTAPDITPIDSIVLIMKDGMRDEVKKDRFPTMKMSRTVKITG